MILLLIFILVILLAVRIHGGKEEIEIRPYAGENIEAYLADLGAYEGADYGDKNPERECFIMIYFRGALAGFVEKYLCGVGALYILPEYRNLRLGSALMKRVVDTEHPFPQPSECGNLKCSQLVVGILKTNPEYARLLDWYIRLGFDRLKFTNFKGTGLFHSTHPDGSISIGEMKELMREIAKETGERVTPNTGEREIQKKIETLVRHFCGQVSFNHFEPPIGTEKYSVFDNAFGHGERFIRCLADPRCEAYVGINSANKKSINKTFAYTFIEGFGRAADHFVINEPGEGFYPEYYTGPKEFTIELREN